MKRLNRESLSLFHLIDRIYSDAIFATNKGSVLDELREQLSLSVCSVALLESSKSGASADKSPATHNPAPGRITFSKSIDDAETSKKLLRQYTEYFYLVDPLRKFALQNGTTGFLDIQSKLYGRKIADTEFYNEFAKVGGSEHFFRSIQSLGGSSSIGVTFNKHGSKTGFSPTERQVISSLIPHLKNSVLISRVIEHSERNDEGILKSQQTHGKCGFVLDALGNIVVANENGEELLESLLGIESRNGRLVFTDLEAQKSLDTFLQPSKVRPGPIEIPQLIEFPAKLKRLPISLNCRAIKKTLDFSAQNLRKKHAFLEISSPWAQGWPPIRNTASCSILTHREKQVLFSLLNHQCEAVAAEELTIGLNTLRTHRKNLYDKMFIENRRMLFERF